MYRQKLPKQNTSEIQVFFQSRCISINFPRIFLFALATYSRASQPQFNFPRIYLLAFAVYSRASQPHLISREYTYIPSQYIPAQAGKNKQNTSEIQVFFQSRCIPINIPRIYLHPFAAYSRASRPHYDLRGDSLQMEVCGNAGCLI